MRESEREREWERVGKSGRVRVRKPLRTAKEPALVSLLFLIMHLDSYLRYMEGPARYEQPPDPSNLGGPPPQAFQMIQVVMKDQKGQYG